MRAGKAIPGLNRACYRIAALSHRDVFQSDDVFRVGLELGEPQFGERTDIFGATNEAARIKPAVVQVESHPYVPETELLEFCKQRGIVFLAFAPLGHGIKPATPRSAARARENFDISPLSADALGEINRIQTRQRLNPVVQTGIPGFIPQSRSTAQGR